MALLGISLSLGRGKVAETQRHCELRLLGNLGNVGGGSSLHQSSKSSARG